MLQSHTTVWNDEAGMVNLILTYARIGSETISGKSVYKNPNDTPVLMPHVVK